MTEPTPDAADLAVDSEHTTDAHPSHEAAKYRVRLRETEAEVQRLTTALAAAQRSQIESLVGSALNPETFWKLTDPAELLDDTGAVDPELVREAAQKVRQEIGTVKPQGRGLVSGAQSGAPAKAPSFVDAFSPKRG